jgi:hypothetical protein
MALTKEWPLKIILKYKWFKSLRQTFQLVATQLSARSYSINYLSSLISYTTFSGGLPAGLRLTQIAVSVSQ